MVWGRTSASHPGLVDILLVTSWETHWTLMVSVLDSGSRGPGSNTGLRVMGPDSRPGCVSVVFLGKTLYSHSASPHSGV